MGTSPADLNEAIHALIESAQNSTSVSTPSNPSTFSVVKASPIEKVKGRVILLETLGSLEEANGWLESASDYLIFIKASRTDVDSPHPVNDGSSSSVEKLAVSASCSQRILSLKIVPSFGSGKSSDSNIVFLSDTLPRSVSFAKSVLLARSNEEQVRLTIATEASYLATDQMIGVAMAVLQACFDEEGGLRTLCSGVGGSPVNPTKESLRLRLQWIQSNFSRANPSRSTLKRVNEFFMSPGAKGDNVRVSIRDTIQCGGSL